ncbi:peptidoglycan-binding domain-containing protein [Asticcacaulis sp. 201]|uniref:peptidoglycan-binding domain-containing protein n=1 Tax=Asticcacaulis sp. 201 TaxID=3028787 RepID=UPI0029169037|nr:peptidoglycan-binding domain-containing protein [Asticcacaulis sp. 201]MDV6332758.1 peptidoglycan-binding domain-containing protein [Asticcacaulis sp. 201]
MRKLFLKSGAAVIVLAGLTMAAPVFATADAADSAKPAVPPVSTQFRKESRDVAVKTLDVVQTGAGDESYDGQAQGDRHVEQVIAMTAQQATAQPIACPKGDINSPEWQQVPEDLRRNAIPGQCFSRLMRAPKVETYREHAMVQPERTETRVVPPVIEMVEETVVVEPERVERRVVPAVTHTEMVEEVVSPASYREEVVPPRYEKRTEHVMVDAPRQEWERHDGVPLAAPMVTPIDHAPVRYRSDGTLTWPGKTPQSVPVDDEVADYMAHGAPQDVWSLEQVPGVYQKRTARVEVAPEQVRRIDIPARTRRVKHTVVDVAEHYEDVVIPAVIEKRHVKKVVREGRTEAYTVPAVYEEVERQRVAGQPELVWREVICGKNTSTQKIMEVQRALAARGYQPGPIDGHLGKQTVAAMQKFQADNDLAQGQPSVEAVRLLGVPLVPLK